MCVFVPLFSLLRFTVRRAFPHNTPPPVEREKKERKVFLPSSFSLSLPLCPSLSFTTPATDWSSLRSQPWDPFPGPQRHKLLSVHDEIDWMENVYDFLCMKKPQGSVWSPPSPLSQELEKGGVLCFALLCFAGKKNAFLCKKLTSATPTAAIFVRRTNKSVSFYA